jgi:hypothetical protein
VKEIDLTLLINWQISTIFDVFETFCLDLSAIAEINILRLFLDNRGCSAAKHLTA